MACPHHGARPKAVDLSKPLERYYDLEDEHPECLRIIAEVDPNVHEGLDHMLTQLFTDDLLKLGIAKVKFPDDREAQDGYEFDWLRVQHALPDVTRSLLANIHMYDQYSSRGPGCRLSELFNYAGRELCDYLDLPYSAVRRRFTCRFGFESTGERLTDFDERRKPEVVMVDSDVLEGEITWADVHVPVVVFDDRECDERAYRQLLSMAYRIFRAKQPRNYILGVAFFGTHFAVYLFDRSSVYITGQFRMSGIGFTRLLVSLLFLEDWVLGHDASVVKKGDQQYVLVNGDEYLVKEVLYLHPHFVGNGTVIRLVERDGQQYINKDMWTNRVFDSKEPLTLMEIKGIKNVVQLENHEALLFPNGKACSSELFTRWILERQKADMISKDVRVTILDHHQIIESPVGDRLNSFRSLEELVSALRDVAYAIVDLAKKAHVCHADISHKNIVLVPNSDPSALRSGCLIDFGVAADIGKFWMQHGARGQFFYMSCDVLHAGANNYAYDHRPYHDLESLLYVLCWESIVQDGPNVSYASHAKENDAVYSRWSASFEGKNDQWRVAWEEKYYDVISEDRFEEEVLDRFNPYFRSLKPCARALRKILCTRRYTERERSRLGKMYDAMLREKRQRQKQRREIEGLDEEIEQVRQEYAESGNREDREEEIIKAVLKVWDETLDGFRRKVEKAAAPEEEKEKAKVEKKVGKGEVDKGKTKDIPVTELKGTDAKEADKKCQAEERGEVKDAGKVPDTSQKAESRASDVDTTVDELSRNVEEEKLDAESRRQREREEDLYRSLHSDMSSIDLFIPWDSEDEAEERELLDGHRILGDRLLGSRDLITREFFATEEYRERRRVEREKEERMAAAASRLRQETEMLNASVTEDRSNRLEHEASSSSESFRSPSPGPEVVPIPQGMKRKRDSEQSVTFDSDYDSSSKESSVESKRRKLDAATKEAEGA